MKRTDWLPVAATTRKSAWLTDKRSASFYTHMLAHQCSACTLFLDHCRTWKKCKRCREMEGVQYHVPSTIYHVGCKKDFFVEVLIFLSLLVHKHPAAIVVLWASASSPANCLIFRRNLPMIHLFHPDKSCGNYERCWRYILIEMHTK